MTDSHAARHAARIAENNHFFEFEIPKIREAGRAALYRLLPVAQGDTGQSGVIAKFLLGLYNGPRFPFDLTELRRLDRELIDDCLTVLKMDWCPEIEVHQYFDNGGKIFEQLAEYWVPDNDKSR